MRNHKDTIKTLSALQNAIKTHRSEKYCLRLWSVFIRTRDRRSCVLCNSKNRLSAHHIVRKSFWAHLRFQPGNGITLCHECHKEPHEKYNGRPNLQLPMDAEGGENIDLMTGMFGALMEDARRRRIPFEPFYTLSQSSILAFKRIQGISERMYFPGSPIEQAYLIWNQTPRGMFEAILASLGVQVPDDYVQTDAMALYQSETIRGGKGATGHGPLHEICSSYAI